ncbi:31864_t:CDS:2 [Gigaspora margarita]|uniref:31864_t:CDS:1 n=1 Tax=Gigaspora margarita TaxID=4874 RepID=A0ABN7V2R8_GIGMA|nr:31864_t:CDS:2 [Gigaspora margarita]
MDRLSEQKIDKIAYPYKRSFAIVKKWLNFLVNNNFNVKFDIGTFQNEYASNIGPSYEYTAQHWAQYWLNVANAAAAHETILLLRQNIPDTNTINQILINLQVLFNINESLEEKLNKILKSTKFRR